MNAFIEDQNWRYATKKYDTNRKVSNEDLAILKEAIRLSVSSFGLQPYQVFVIDNPEILEKLQGAASFNKQVSQSSHLFVFANLVAINADDVDTYVQKIIDTRGTPREELQGLSKAIKSSIESMDANKKSNWAAKQTYIALANLINAAATIKVDATPMEGFDVEGFNEILGLKEKGLTAAVIATIGYRHEADELQYKQKVRKSNEELFITL